MWKVSYQKLMSILLSSRYIPQDKEKEETISGKELYKQLKQAQNYL